VNLRAQGRLNEIRAQDLCFTQEEAHVLLQNMLGKTVDMAAVQSMEEQTEGWVTGLRLAALALRHRVGKQRIEVLPTPNNKYVSDYLMSEILDNQVASFSEWLLKSSILARFNPGLCEAVCLDERAELSQPEGVPQLEGEGFLKWLVDSNLFAIPLDDYNHWIRYHHLFREFLRTELGRRYGQTEISALHIRASEWFAQQGFIDEALQHALDAGDLLLAAQLVEQNGPALLDEDKWYVLERWLAQLPDDIIQQRAQLLLIKAWVLFYHFALRDIPALLESVEAILDVEASTLG
jgi:LuxR family maltose regulon positive regulatory protein